VLPEVIAVNEDVISLLESANNAFRTLYPVIYCGWKGLHIVGQARLVLLNGMRMKCREKQRCKGYLSARETDGVYESGD
jgi:hypothetical protein